MQTFYIPLEKNFPFRVNTVHAKSLEDAKIGFIDYSNEPVKQYLEKNSQNESDILTWQQLEKLMDKHEALLKIKSFTEINENDFYNALECLPPKKWNKFKNGQFFFLGECSYSNIYAFFVQYKDKFYSKNLPINMSTEDLILNIENDLGI